MIRFEAAVPFVGGVLYVFLGDKKPSQRLQFAFLKQIKNQNYIIVIMK